jgi:drug/metabolite transporter (DMT)-like permease
MTVTVLRAGGSSFGRRSMTSKAAGQAIDPSVYSNLVESFNPRDPSTSELAAIIHCLSKSSRRKLSDCAVRARRRLSTSGLAAAGQREDDPSVSQTTQSQGTMNHHEPGAVRTAASMGAAFYIVSGVCQPLLVTLCQTVGVADHTAQLNMLFYYLGPSVLLVAAFRDEDWPPHPRVAKQAAGIALMDMFAQTLNYTGAAWAGPTVFAIVYSSVTIWTAVVSRVLLARVLTSQQWMSIGLVFGGLCWTASSSLELGHLVARGTVLVVFGSGLHGATYVLSEAIMKESHAEHTLSPKQNAAIQGSVAFAVLGLWQIVYTVPNWDKVIGEPVRAGGATWWSALLVLVAFASTNLIHSVSFSHTLKHYPGGATSAGVMKGLQAVLVFVAAHVLYCGRLGGSEMCFSSTKFVSLITVCGGVAWFGVLAEYGGRLPAFRKDGYARIDGVSLHDHNHDEQENESA